MLLQFSVENFLSFDEEQVFSMVASIGDHSHPNHVIEGKGGAALRAAAIYGSNASGKSNLVQSISFAQDLIVQGTRRSQLIPTRPFKLRPDGAKRPSKFGFIFRTNGVLYNYGFRVMSARVVDEWLYASHEDEEVELFERSTSDQGMVEIEQAALSKADDPQFYQFLAKGTRPNQLYLTELTEHNVEAVKPITDWFEHVLRVVPAESRSVGLAARVYHNDRFKSYLTDFLRAAGTGIDSAEASYAEADLATLFPDMPPAQRDEATAMLNDIDQHGLITIESPDGSVYQFTKDKTGRVLRIELNFRHVSQPEGHQAILALDEESDGTQRLINLAPVISQLRESPERVVILDELDRRFHPHLSRLLVETALSARPDGSSNQLIFTTHDTNLLDIDLLRRDEIWFVEKANSGASHIYSLVEFSVDSKLKMEKGYLNGRFGAIPFITPIENLGLSIDPELFNTEPVGLA